MNTTIPFLQYSWIIFLIISSCNTIKRDKQVEKEEIIAIEHAFMERVSERGLRDAFTHFADDHAVLARNNQLIRGKKEIMKYYDQQEGKDIQLTWEPEYVEVADCGDLAYTFGTYTYSIKDSTGYESTSKGIFHTIWKRQEDGSWKYVYD